MSLSRASPTSATGCTARVPRRSARRRPRSSSRSTRTWKEARMSDSERADAVYEKLLARAGERWVQPRKERTARILELLDDPQKTYRVVHITGTNGKTSTARMIESLLRAHGLRT